MNAITLARLFHETYERLAPRFGYETRPETRAFDPDSPNGRLMITACGEILGSGVLSGVYAFEIAATIAAKSIKDLAEEWAKLPPEIRDALAKE